MENLSGQKLGKYTLTQEIGRGAMGAVYLGQDPLLERQVAIKILAPHLTWETEFVERFLREARTAARLKHPNVVTIYDVGQEGSWYYFVMEYLEGETLRDYIRRRGPLPPAEAVAILQQLASALDYAHRQGVIHRDIKPANVMVAPDGRATLTDFGIVKAATDRQLTATGMTLGTPEYMAPEQAAQGLVVPASDLYALAVIAYEMFSGNVPFRGDSTIALLYRIVNEPPPPIGSVRPDLPRGVETVLQRALAKVPEARYASGGDFVAALGQALAGRPVEPAPYVETPTTMLEPLHGPAARPAPPARPARAPVPAWAWALIGALLVALIATPVIMAMSRAPATPVPPLVITQPRPTEPTQVALVEPTATPEPAPTVPTATPEPTTTPRPTAEPTAVPTGTPGAEVSQDMANLRSGPGTNYGAVGQLSRGDKVTVIAWAYAANGELWYLIELWDGTRAWVHQERVTVNGAVAALPPAATVPPTPRPQPTAIPPTPVPPTSSARQKTVTVYANRLCGNQDTGVWVNAGEYVEVSSWGSWAHTSNVDKNCPTPFSPDGCGYNHTELLLPKHSIGILLGIVDSGPYVVIGTYERWRSGVSGNVYLCMNEDPRSYGDNVGQITAVITVSP